MNQKIQVSREIGGKARDRKHSLRKLALLLTILAIGLISFGGEWGSYLRALYYLKRVGGSGSLLFADLSAAWLFPPTKRAIILSPKSPPRDKKLLSKAERFLLLEHSGTGIQLPLPDRTFCREIASFGFLPYFHLYKCFRRAQKPWKLSENLQKAEISLRGKRCRWRGKNCRFGPSWRRVALEEGFTSHRVARRCIFAHPHSGKRLSLKTPEVEFGGGLKLVFAFRDGYRGDVPLSVRGKVLCRGEGVPREFFQTSLEHRPGWRRFFVSSEELPCWKGELSIELWTSNAGAKPFCLDLFAYKKSAHL